jgi:2,5-diamino-6-(ribosylamino)-4(3H)-pyrimidinone 5'-phosphate reductase
MKRPYVIINCAMSADGKIALPNKQQLRISSRKDIERMYKLRNTCDAVLVGINTILTDDPKLTVKDEYMDEIHQPIRVVLDTHCRTPLDALVVNEKSKTYIFTKKDIVTKKFGKNVEIIVCDTDEEGLIDISNMLQILARKGIKSLMVEGGGTIIWNFLKKGFVDDIYVYIGPIIIGGCKTPTLADGKGITDEDDKIKLTLVGIDKLGDGILTHYKLIK